MDATIESIEVKVGKKTYKFSAEEAKALCDALTALLGDKTQYVPYSPPAVPYYPPTWIPPTYPTYPIITYKTAIESATSDAINMTDIKMWDYSQTGNIC